MHILSSTATQEAVNKIAINQAFALVSPTPEEESTVYFAANRKKYNTKHECLQIQPLSASSKLELEALVQPLPKA